MKKRFLNILFWAVISAAFIGPGTITTAAAAGAEFGYSLIWALVFSTVACIVLQEASARLTMSSGINLGEALKKYLNVSPVMSGLLGMIVGAVILGCAAYEAGNILGAVAGITLIYKIPAYWIVLAMGGIVLPLFWYGTVESVAKVMGVLVAFMGICFLITAVLMKPDLGAVAQSLVIPEIPDGSSMLILALIGTTVVPYNLFLGSGIASGQDLKEMRWSLSIAIGLGGLISIGVLIVGTAITGSFTFDGLASALTQQLGGWASLLLGLGLFAAGLSSSITAPLAAAVTAQSVADDEDKAKGGKWAEPGRNFRAVWMGVLLIGLAFGASQVQPVPAIILAQALNGIILPMVAVALLILVNNLELMTQKAANTVGVNILMSIVVFITIIIGVRNVARALSTSLPVELVNETYILITSVVISVLISWPVYRMIKKLRGENLKE
ncbi:Nramp family divalent metal transporter [Fodinibius halophilus]|uniref:Divalent metal cation transporter n=1 Tax=Fodinibius halophilus TaxID=1736908 RepID=A0A6M1T799_9BACT|nr:Nramp family divalent metal transporter [Fodinibius halophilus]NGP89989.1 divalent metal cation transporter [Fodinibius halophilus]